MTPNAVPAHSLYGEPAMRDAKPAFQAEGAAPAPPGGMPYTGHTRCMGNDATCQGHRAKGTDYCMGHLRQIARDVKERDVESV
jgi:hypothetical protein